MTTWRHYYKDGYVEEFQDENTLICLEFADEIDTSDNVRIAYGQRVKETRIDKGDIWRIFTQHAEVCPIDKYKLERFYSQDTIMYSARKVRSRSENPIADCIRQLDLLECNDESWIYLIKISVNRNTKLSAKDLWSLICNYQDKQLMICDSVSVAIGYDDKLEDGEVEIFKVHYCCDDGGDFLSDTYCMCILPDHPFEEVKKGFLSYADVDQLRGDAFWWVGDTDTERHWSETEKVLDFLYSQKCRHVYVIVQRYCERFNEASYDEKTESSYEILRNVVKWAVAHGVNINRIYDNGTTIDNFIYEIDSIRGHREKNEECLHLLVDFVAFLRSMGGLTKDEYRKKIEQTIDEMSPVQLLEMEGYAGCSF